MSDQLQGMAAEAERQSAEVMALAADLDEATFSRRPAESRWSVGEHVAHLSLTDGPYLEAIGRALSAGPPARPNQRFEGGRIGNWFARMMEPPPKRRMRTSRKLEPQRALDRGAVLAEFRGCREEMMETLRAAEGVDIDRAAIRSPFLWLLRMPVFSAYGVLLAHGRRHIWLVRETIEALAEPDRAGDGPDVAGDRLNVG